MPTSQTLSRGIRVLEIVANSPVHLSIAEIAEKLEVHRSIAYRIIRTLEQHHLLNRDDAGHIRSASGLAVLARSVQHDLQAISTVELTTLANELSMTAFVAVWEYDLCTTLQSVAPLNSQRAIVHRPGSVHGMDVGAAGIAIQSHYTKEQWDALESTVDYRDAAVQARLDGYATSENEVIQGVTSIAVPIAQPGQIPAALAVVFASSTVDSYKPIIEELKLAAQRITGKLSA